MCPVHTFRLHPQVTASASFAALKGEVDTFPTADPIQVREPLSRLLPTSAILGLEWNSLNGRMWFGGLLRAAVRQDRLSTRDLHDTQRIPLGGTPGYAVLDLRGGWHIRPRVTISAVLENMTDQDYRIHGSGINEPGRNLVFALDLKF